MPFGVGEGSADDVIDFILTADCVDTAFTDFSTHVKFQVDYAGRHWSDSDGLFACMKRAMDNGIPILDGKFLAQVTRPELERIFAGNIEMPMLDEKMEVWHQVGAVLAEKYNGRFHNFVKSCPPRLYDNGAGIVDRMVREFPRFNDVSPYDGATIKIYKLPQLGIWLAYSALRKNNQFPLEDHRQDDGFRRLHRSRRIAASGNHELLARTRACDQHLPDDSARQPAGS